MDRLKLHSIHLGSNDNLSAGNRLGPSFRKIVEARLESQRFSSIIFTLINSEDHTSGDSNGRRLSGAVGGEDTSITHHEVGASTALTLIHQSTKRPMLEFHTLGLVGPSLEVVVCSDIKPVTSVIGILEKSEMMVGEDVHGRNSVIIPRNKTGRIADKGHFTSVFGSTISFGAAFTPVVVLDTGDNIIPFSISFPFARLDINEFSLQVTVFEKSHVETRRNNN